jgi:hypothetical protein
VTERWETIMKWMLIAALLIGFAACSTGSVTVTGTPRSPIAATDVRVYAEPPADYEVIALLESAPSSAWTDQRRQDAAVADLKEKAAQLGANGILLTGVSDSGGERGGSVGVSSGGGVGVGVGMSKASKTVFAKAIFVKREK